jgi:hypothetical protein
MSSSARFSTPPIKVWGSTTSGGSSSASRSSSGAREATEVSRQWWRLGEESGGRFSAQGAGEWFVRESFYKGKVWRDMEGLQSRFNLLIESPIIDFLVGFKSG